MKKKEKYITSLEDDIEYKKLIARIKEIRKEKKMTQMDLSYESGLNKNFISDVERCFVMPSIQNILKICKTLKIHPAILFLDKDKDEYEIELINLKYKNND